MRAQEAEDLMNPEAAAERKARQEANAARVAISGRQDRLRGLTESRARSVAKGDAASIAEIDNLISKEEEKIESLGGIPHTKRKREKEQDNTLF
jgi:hypothetical protein